MEEKEKIVNDILKINKIHFTYICKEEGVSYTNFYYKKVPLEKMKMLRNKYIEEIKKVIREIEKEDENERNN